MSGAATAALMKIAVTSDLHLGLTSPQKLKALATAIRAAGVDLLCVAGDTGEPLNHFAQCLGILAAARIPKIAVVPGNHDLWTSQGYSSSDLLRQLLPEACRNAGCVWLETDDVHLADGTAVCGSVAWYDYSDQTPEVCEDAVTYKALFNNDGNYIRWEWSDTEFSALCRAALLKRLTALQQDPAVARIVLVTHVPLFPAQYVSHPEDPPSTSLYFRNYVTGRAIAAAGISKLQWVVGGHTHRGVAPQKIRLGHHWVTTAAMDSDYGWPSHLVIEI